MGDQPSLASIAATPSQMGAMSQMSLTSTTTGAEKRSSAQEASLESHAAKIARMEAPPDAGMGFGGGIPETIEE